MKSIVLILTVVAIAQSQVINLEQYNIDPSTVTVSGLSSGGCFSTQYHVVHSAELMGAAIFAGVAYYCANGNEGTAILCMDAPYLTNVNTLVKKAESEASKGSIDSTTGMSGDKIYILAGTKDTVVKPANGPQIEQFYQSFSSDIITDFTIVAEHCQPTDFYGPACTYNGGEYINNCNYDGAYEALNFMFGGTLIKASSTIPLLGEFSLFNQKEYFPSNTPSKDSMDDSGYIYIPSGCVDKATTCHLHVVFHGCLQNKQHMGDTFAKNTGYLQVAEANNIIMLFPQTIKELLANPNGCWDWWGYTGILKYATYDGPQVAGVYGMTQRLIYGY